MTQELTHKNQMAIIEVLERRRPDHKELQRRFMSGALSPEEVEAIRSALIDEMTENGMDEATDEVNAYGKRLDELIGCLWVFQ